MLSGGNINYYFCLCLTPPRLRFFALAPASHRPNKNGAERLRFLYATLKCGQVKSKTSLNWIRNLSNKNEESVDSGVMFLLNCQLNKVKFYASLYME